MQVVHKDDTERRNVVFIPCSGSLLGLPNLSIGTTLPDVAIAAGWRYFKPAARDRYTKATGWTDNGTDMIEAVTETWTDAELAQQAADAEAQRLADEAAYRAQALAYQQQLDNAELRTRGLALVIFDEINRLSTRLRGLDAAIAEATSLADLKTRVAALPAIPDRTVAQLKQAVAAKVAEIGL